MKIVENLGKICYNHKEIKYNGGANMRTKLIKTIFIILTVIFVLSFLKTISFAGEKIDTSKYQTNVQYDEAEYIFNKGGVILNLLRNFAAIVSVLTLTIIGLRYMVGSVEQKAEYKQTMVPVVIGCALIGGLSAILTMIQTIF